MTKAKIHPNNVALSSMAKALEDDEKLKAKLKPGRVLVSMLPPKRIREDEGFRRGALPLKRGDQRIRCDGKPTPLVVTRAEYADLIAHGWEVVGNAPEFPPVLTQAELLDRLPAAKRRVILEREGLADPSSPARADASEPGEGDASPRAPDDASGRPGGDASAAAATDGKEA